MNLTPKQLKVLKLISEHRKLRGLSPTMQELSDALNVSRVTVFEHVQALIKKGALKREPNRARSLSLAEGIQVPGNEETDQKFPLLGRIAAGQPIEKVAQADHLDLFGFFGKITSAKNDIFALEVEGDSMKDEGIIDGDFVLVRKQSSVRNGDRVVALLPNGETTLKSFYREPDGKIRLQPANDSFKPIYVDNCTIQGVLIGTLRRY